MIRKTTSPAGTGAVTFIEGDSKEEVQAEAERIKSAIDFMRSPHITQNAARDACGIWHATVRYFGLD